jgi:hypothetical protein
VSIHIMEWVWNNSPSRSGRLLVMLALADWADEEGNSWPRVGTLAARARLSPRRVEQVLHELAADGEIELPEGRPGNRERPYRLREFLEATRSQLRVEPEAHDGSNPKLASGLNILKEEPSIEPSIEPSRASAEIAQVWSTYEATFPRKRIKLGDRERRVIRAALRVRSAAECCEAVEGLARDEWCMGHKPRPYDAIGYALGAVGKESAEERIDRMVAQARQASVGQGKGSSEVSSYLRLLDSVPSGQREIVRAHVNTILQCNSQPNSPTLTQRAEVSARWLRDRLGVEVACDAERRSVEVKRV